VDYRGAQAGAHPGTWPRRHRHGFARSADRHPNPPHQHADRALQDPCQGQPLAPRSLDDGQQAAVAAGLSEAQGHSGLRGADRQAGAAEV
ncbi:MAG: SSU ribosomal protein S15p (S13e), partial [uncultured Sphingomonas sp.]